MNLLSESFNLETYLEVFEQELQKPEIYPRFEKIYQDLVIHELQQLSLYTIHT